jgi:hypothetical protein
MAKERNAEKIASKLDIVATAFGDLQKTEVGSDFAMMLLQTTLRAVTSAFSEDIKTTFPDVKAEDPEFLSQAEHAFKLLGGREGHGLNGWLGDLAAEMENAFAGLLQGQVRTSVTARPAQGGPQTLDDLAAKAIALKAIEYLWEQKRKEGSTISLGRFASRRGVTKVQLERFKSDSQRSNRIARANLPFFDVQVAEAELRAALAHLDSRRRGRKPKS